MHGVGEVAAFQQCLTTEQVVVGEVAAFQQSLTTEQVVDRGQLDVTRP